MSCWVAPAIAAELWNMTVQAVLEGISRGTIPTRKEEGFTFVDIAPESPRFEPPRAYRKEHRPPTFVAISPEEAAALSEGLPQTADAVMADEVATLSVAAEIASRQQSDDIAALKAASDIVAGGSDKQGMLDAAAEVVARQAEELLHQTYRTMDVVSAVEADALLGSGDFDEMPVVTRESLQAPLVRDEQAEGSLSNWREVRQRAGRGRVPPARAVA